VLGKESVAAASGVINGAGLTIRASRTRLLATLGKKSNPKR